MSDQSRLTELNIQIAQWEQQRDKDAIGQLALCLSDTLIFRRADRTTVDKAAFLKALNGPSPFVSRETRNVTVTVSQDRAMAIVTVITVKKDGERNAYRNVRLFSRHGEAWRLEFWFNDDVSSLSEL
jgi:hypothetical protein